MKHYARLVWVFVSLLFLGNGFGQETLHPAGNPAFTQQELDQMLAPIALYPDPLLAHVLMAATYPLEVVEAARWSRDNPDLKGDVAVRGVAGKDWDASVKSLVAFPQILQTMDEKIEWTERLGDAFLAQPTQVMDTVQALRSKAAQAGNLQSNAQVRVGQDGDDITIEPDNTEVIYVPYYDPNLIYGPWWWPYYPPVYWGPWYGYYWSGGIAWGVGFVIGVDFFFGEWDWPHHQLYYNGHGRWYGHAGGSGSRPWNHDPVHRRGVPYRNEALDRQFGHAPSPAANTVEPYREREAAAPSPQSYPGRGAYEQANGADVRGGAFESVGHGSDARENSARGGASMGGSHGGFSGGFHGGGGGNRGH